jgi:hypothetical protein
LLNRIEKHETPEGMLYAVLVPEDAPDSNVKYGIRLGPPDLSSLGLDKEVERRLNNELYNRGLLTLRDTKRRSGDVMAAWQAAIQTDVATILNCYAEGSTDAR